MLYFNNWCGGKLAWPSLNANWALIYSKISRTTLWAFDLRLGRGVSPNFQGRSKGRNGAGMEIVRLRKKRISSLLLNIFLFGKKSHNLWSHSFQNILSFKDFVNIWYERTRPEWTEVVKSRNFHKRVSVKYLLITRKIFNISSIGKLSHNLWGKAFKIILSLWHLIYI